MSPSVCGLHSVFVSRESERRGDEAAVGDVSSPQTRDQMLVRKLQLGSWGKSAKLFIGLMGCHLR